MQNKEPLFRMVKRGQISFAMITAIHLAALALALKNPPDVIKIVIDCD